MVKDKQFYRQILALSLPAAFQSALSLLVVMADNVMVTRTGAYALSAVAQSNAITTFVTAGLNGLATGAVVLISQYWGKRDMKRIAESYLLASATLSYFTPKELSAIWKKAVGFTSSSEEGGSCV